MSISVQQAAQELKEDLSNLLPDRYRPCDLSKRLAKDLSAYCFPESPGNFEDACIFFRTFFEEISHPDIVSFGWSSRGPIIFGNILFAIKKIGSRLRVFRRILNRTCERYCQYEALFAVMCEALQRFSSNNRKDFLLKGMIMVRIEQRRKFPPAPNCELTHIFHFSLDEILGMMKRKNGMSGHEETRRQMERSLRIYNSYWNEQYSAPIRRLLQSKPKFFSDFATNLENYYQYIIRQGIRDNLVSQQMLNNICDFWDTLTRANIYSENKKWIEYWYIRYREDHRSEPRQGQESFNDFMTRIVQPGQMAFPFKEPPRLFKTNSRFFRAALNCESVPTSDLLEICYRSHVKSQYGWVPSQCVLAASVRRKLRKLYEVKITKAAVKIQKFARRSLWQFYLKRLIAAMIIKKQVLRVVTPILQLKRAKSLIVSAVKQISVQKVYFEKLDTYRYLQQIKAGCVIFKVLNRYNHVQEYQKIRARSIIQSRVIALFEIQRLLQRIKNLKAASTLSRFAKVQRAENVRKRLQNFVKDLSCYDCPLCFEDLSSVSIEKIQTCGHIHCKACFDQIGTKCSCCRAEFIQSDCKSVGTFLSKSKPKFFFTRVNPEKKAAIEVIIKWWAMKRRLVERI